MENIQMINILLVTLLGAAALRWGAAPERICAAVLLFVTLADPLYHLLVGRSTIYGSVDMGHLLIDLGLAVTFLGVALWANRIYPLWLAAFQLVSVISHFVREVTEIFPKLAYGIMSYGPYSIILLILAAGIWRHRTRVRRYGRYRSWRISSNPLPDRLPTPQPNG